MQEKFLYRIATSIEIANSLKNSSLNSPAHKIVDLNQTSQIVFTGTEQANRSPRRQLDDDGFERVLTSSEKKDIANRLKAARSAEEQKAHELKRKKQKAEIDKEKAKKEREARLRAAPGKKVNIGNEDFMRRKWQNRKNNIKPGN